MIQAIVVLFTLSVALCVILVAIVWERPAIRNVTIGGRVIAVSAAMRLCLSKDGIAQTGIMIVKADEDTRHFIVQMAKEEDVGPTTVQLRAGDLFFSPHGTIKNLEFLGGGRMSFRLIFGEKLELVV